MNLRELESLIAAVDLKKGQQKAIEGLLQWYDYRLSMREIESDNASAILKGSPGTGKSFTVAQYVLNLIAKLKPATNKEFKVFLIAPTNQAKENLRDFAQEAQLWKYCKVTCTTIHALGGMTMMGLNEEGYQQEDWADDREKETPNLIIVDEYSMINEHVYSKTEPIFSRYPTLFVGDLDQLPPVPDSKNPDTLAIGDSIVNEKNPNFQFNLTEVVRYSGNILKYIHAIKNNITPHIYGVDSAGNETCFPNPNIRFTATLPDVSLCGTDIQVMEKEEFLESKIKRLAEDERVWTDLNHLKVAAYTNAGVLYWNQALRRARFTDDDQYMQVNVGESMIVKDPVYGYVDGTMRRLFYTNQKFQPIDVQTVDLKVEYLPDEPVLEFQRLTAVNVYQMATEFLFPSHLTLHKLSNEFMLIFRKLKASKKEASELRKDWNIWNSQLKIWGLAYKGNPNEKNPIKRQTTFYYGSTIHSLQGTTLNHVILDWKDILKARDKEDQKRLAYVAASRARESLTILI